MAIAIVLEAPPVLVVVVVVLVVVSAVLPASGLDPVQVNPPIEDQSFLISSQAFVKSFEFRLTAPISCPIAVGQECSVVINMTSSHPNEIVLDKPSIKWLPEQANETRTINVTAGPGLNVNLEAQVTVTTHTIRSAALAYDWHNPPDIRLHTPSKRSAQCHGTGAWHLSTFDEFRLHIYAEGHVVLYKQAQHAIEIQAELREYGDRPPTAQAIALRDGQDVFTLNISANGQSHQFHQRCVSLECTCGTYPSVSTRGNSYTINLASGIQLRMTLAFWSVINRHYINAYVTVPGHDAGRVTGLCGNFDGTRDNDAAVGYNEWVYNLNQLDASQLASYDLSSWSPPGSVDRSPAVTPLSEACASIKCDTFRNHTRTRECLAVAPTFDKARFQEQCVQRMTGMTGPQEVLDDVALGLLDETCLEIRLSANTVLEHRPAGTLVGNITVHGFRAAYPHAYSLDQGAGNFVLVGSELRTARPFDFEREPEKESVVPVSIRALAVGGAPVMGSFLIRVLDQREHPTGLRLELTGGQRVSESAPAGTVLGAIVAEDVDENTTTLAFHLSDNATDTLQLGTPTCNPPSNSSARLACHVDVLLVGRFDFERTPSHTFWFHVLVSDEGGLTTGADFAIPLDDANDAPTGLAWIRGGGIPVDAPVGDVVGEFAALDQDVGQSYLVSLTNHTDVFAVQTLRVCRGDQGSPASPQAAFFDNATANYGGSVVVRDASALRAAQVVYLGLAITDTSESPITRVFALQVAVWQRPLTVSFADGTTTAEVPENALVGTVVGSLVVHGVPYGARAPMLRLASPPHAATPFRIQGSRLLVEGSIDYEQHQAFVVDVDVALILLGSPGTEAVRKTQRFTVYVADVNEPLAITALPRGPICVNTAAPPNTTVLQLRAQDPELPGHGVEFELEDDGTGASGLFALSSKGELVLARSPSSGGAEGPAQRLHTAVVQAQLGAQIARATLSVRVDDSCECDLCVPSNQASNQVSSSSSVSSSAFVAVAASLGACCGLLLLFLVAALVALRRQRTNKSDTSSGDKNDRPDRDSCHHSQNPVFHPASAASTSQPAWLPVEDEEQVPEDTRPYETPMAGSSSESADHSPTYEAPENVEDVGEYDAIEHIGSTTEYAQLQRPFMQYSSAQAEGRQGRRERQGEGRPVLRLSVMPARSGVQQQDPPAVREPPRGQSES